MYNNMFNYNPYSGNNYMQTTTPQRTDIRWVNGIVGAKAYQVPNGQTFPLFDADNEGIFYLKTTDQFNMSTMKCYRFAEVNESDLTAPATPQVDLSNYVTKDEMTQKITEEINKLFEGGKDE